MSEANEPRDRRPHESDDEYAKTQVLDREQAPGGAGEAAEADDAAGLRAEIETLQEKLQSQEADHLRLAAELDNTRKRAAREVDNARRYGVERLAGELLEVVDSLEMGLDAARSQDAPKALLEGKEATLRKLLAILDKFGVKRIEADGKRFDPQFHEAMSMVQAPDAEPGTVTMVVQSGYLLHERLLRPARVMVAADPADG